MASLKDDVLAVFKERRGQRISVLEMRSAVADRIVNRHPCLVWCLGKEYFTPTLDRVHEAMHALKEGHRVSSRHQDYDAEYNSQVHI